MKGCRVSPLPSYCFSSVFFESSPPSIYLCLSLQVSGTWVWTVKRGGTIATIQTSTASAISTACRSLCSMTVCPEKGATSWQVSSMHWQIWPRCLELDSCHWYVWFIIWMFSVQLFLPANDHSMSTADIMTKRWKPKGDTVQYNRGKNRVAVPFGQEQNN